LAADRDRARPGPPRSPPGRSWPTAGRSSRLWRGRTWADGTPPGLASRCRRAPPDHPRRPAGRSCRGGSAGCRAAVGWLLGPGDPAATGRNWPAGPPPGRRRTTPRRPSRRNSVTAPAAGGLGGADRVLQRAGFDPVVLPIWSPRSPSARARRHRGPTWSQAPGAMVSSLRRLRMKLTGPGGAAQVDAGLRINLSLDSGPVHLFHPPLGPPPIQCRCNGP